MKSLYPSLLSKSKDFLFIKNVRIFFGKLQLQSIDNNIKDKIV